MSQRLKVLISAYACEPNKGSEPEVGWQWALQMARFHDVTVLTRANNRPNIEPALQALRGLQSLPKFVYHDGHRALVKLKRGLGLTKLYYVLWQRSARSIIQQLQRTHSFDLLHHVTFATYRYPTAIWGQGVPCIWGPIGGVESIPASLLPWHHPVPLLYEIARNAHNFLHSSAFYLLPKRASASTLVLASTIEMQRALARLGAGSTLMPTVGLKTANLPCQPHPGQPGPLRLLFVGNIITLKGIDLALFALKQSGTHATFTLAGDGSYLAAARRLVVKLRLENQVRFLGRLPREQVLRIYSDYDLFVFPSLHDTGGYAVLEAMFNSLPVLCLDCGGPSILVGPECGIKVRLGDRAEVIAALVAGLQFYDRDRTTLAAHGRQARETVLKNYEWDRKGEQMNDCYQRAVARMSHPTLINSPE